MSKELVNMIIAQRTYQANSQTIKTQDEIMQVLMNLK
jgi:flagellar hook protein FlgE